jgi:hypothetical protein
VALSKEAEALYGKQGAKRIERKASKSAMPHKKGLGHLSELRTRAPEGYPGRLGLPTLA